MPRPRTGLGQGLEALVPPLRESTSAFASIHPTPEPPPRTWEVATLRKHRKRQCELTIAPSGLLRKARRRKLKASTLLALGALGASGWELVAINGRSFYLKRPVTPPAE